MALVYRNYLNRPLTNNELDNNFLYLNTEVEARYKIVDFTAEKISDQINTPIQIDGGGGVMRNQTTLELAEQNALNSWLLRDLPPSVGLPTSASKNSVVVRNALGDFAARDITAHLVGYADNATEADHAATSAALDVGVILDISQGGTSANNISNARVNLKVVGTEGNNPMVNTLTLATSGAGMPSLRFGVGTDTSSGLSDGDVWFTSTGIRYRVGGVSQTVAKIDSPIFTGTPKAPYAATSSQISTIDHLDDAIEGLFSNPTNKTIDKIDLKANIASPSFTGTPTAPTPDSSTNTTRIATTAFVQTVAQSKADAAETNANTHSDNALLAGINALFSVPADKANHKIDLKANTASPGFTGTPTAPTPQYTDNSTRIATTSYTRSFVNDQLTSYYTKTQVDGLQDKWGTSRKFVQTTAPTGAVDGDFWFKI